MLWDSVGETHRGIGRPTELSHWPDRHRDYIMIIILTKISRWSRTQPTWFRHGQWYDNMPSEQTFVKRSEHVLCTECHESGHHHHHDNHHPHYHHSHLDATTPIGISQNDVRFSKSSENVTTSGPTTQPQPATKSWGTATIVWRTWERNKRIHQQQPSRYSNHICRSTGFAHFQ